VDNSAWLVALLVIVISAVLIWMMQRRIQALVMVQQALVRDAANMAASLKDAEERLERQQRHAPVEARRVREDTLRALLPIDDHIQRACTHLNEADLEALRQGFSLLAKDLDHIWQHNDVARVRPDAGADFDPHEHEAIATQPPAPDDEANTAQGIAHVARDGFRYQDTLLRPAQVVVWQPAEDTSGSVDPDDTPDASVDEAVETFDIIREAEVEVGVS